MKLLLWDGTGLVLVAKRFEKGSFRWPGISDGVMRAAGPNGEPEGGAERRPAASAKNSGVRKIIAPPHDGTAQTAHLPTMTRCCFKPHARCW